MTMIFVFAMILVCGAYESIVEYYGFNLEAKIREMQFGKEY